MGARLLFLLLFDLLVAEVSTCSLRKSEDKPPIHAVNLVASVTFPIVGYAVMELRRSRSRTVASPPESLLSDKLTATRRAISVKKKKTVAEDPEDHLPTGYST